MEYLSKLSFCDYKKIDIKESVRISSLICGKYVVVRGGVEYMRE